MSKKRGPAPKPAEQQRTKRISVYFSDVEYESLAQRARNKHDLCNYIRAQVFAGQTQVVVSIPEVNIKAYGELGRVGSNLNQIARHLNSGAPVDLQQLQAEIAAFRMALIEQPS
ncbi:plasmid mobilization relaxosome protein MobC [Pseudomonas sp. LS-2]|uniref:plasmid mobilization protein n=1 Tax=Pseudomonas sp. LS-2 TaxID=2315859 RepID=UPI000E7579B0|nr:plasmid mobilization relaxosome protein MobC [Pseudomonas sp. LS-2]RJX74025.1 plasmid mobilization relaxosome protein MobC [Pseudomonas sp. LS-2]